MSRAWYNGACCGSAPTNLNRILGAELKTKKYHEVVNGAFYGRYCETVWKETHSEVVYVNLGDQRPTTHTKTKELITEMKGWRVREIYTLFLL